MKPQFFAVLGRDGRSGYVTKAYPDVRLACGDRLLGRFADRDAALAAVRAELTRMAEAADTADA